MKVPLSGACKRQKGWGLLERFVERLRGRRLFRRRRSDEWTKALAVLAYHGALSLTRTLEVLRRRRSHEAVRRWVRRCRELFPPPEKRERRTLAMDETKIRIGREGWYLWAAIGLDSREILAVHLPTTRSPFDTTMFLAKVVPSCSNRPLVYVDGDPWYPWALGRYGFPYEGRTFGPRSSIEGWLGLLKRRTGRFHNVVPYRSSEGSVREWTEAWVLIYNWRVLSSQSCLGPSERLWSTATMDSPLQRKVAPIRDARCKPGENAAWVPP